MNRVLTHVVTEYVRLQTALLQTLTARAGRVLHVEELFSWPVRGELEVDGVKWSFSRHGYGYAFTDLASGREVDAHEYIDEHPSMFDAGRLQIYLESVGADEVVIDERRVRVAEFFEIQDALELLVSRGFISVRPSNRSGRVKTYLLDNNQ